MHEEYKLGDGTWQVNFQELFVPKGFQNLSLRSSYRFVKGTTYKNDLIYKLIKLGVYMCV